MVKFKPCFFVCGAPWFGFFLATAALGTALGAVANEGMLFLGNDARLLGRAGGGVASPRSAAWTVVNPAGLLELGRRLDISVYTIRPDFHIRPSGILGNSEVGELDSGGVFLIPSGGLVLPTRNGALGLYGYVSAGQKLDYDSPRNALSHLFQDDADRRLEYHQVRMALAYARSIGGGWSVGAAVHTSFSRLRTDHMTLQLRPAENDFRWDEAFGLGFGLGIYKRWRRFAVGAAYTSRQWSQSFEEYSDLLFDPVDQPHTLQVGVAYNLTPRLELIADYKYLAWSELGLFGKPLPEGGLNWRDQHIFKFGAEWRATERFTLMGGFSHGNSPIEADHAFISALIPVTVEDHATLGASYTLGPKLDLHVAYVRILENTVTDSGEGDIFSRFAGGTEIGMHSDAVVIGFTRRF